MKDYYATLGVSRTASEKEIKQAFRRLARQYHPDVNPGDRQAEARFKEIREAYEVLSDPQRRRAYDTGSLRRGAAQSPSYDDLFRRRASSRTRQRTTAGSSTSGADGFSDFVRSFFRSGEGPRARTVRGTKGEDYEQTIEVTLEDAFTGTWRRIASPVNAGKQIEVKIPTGVQDGQRIRVAGGGYPGVLGGPRGDLYLKVRLRPHPVFRRVGNDLETRIDVPLGIALLGGEVSVPTLKGKVQLRIPPETQNGTVFRLRGQGMPDVQGGPTGDLLAEVKVQLPTKLTPRQQALVAELCSTI